MATAGQDDTWHWRPSRRSALRAWSETRGWIGGYTTPAETVFLNTDDRVPIAASYLRGPSPDAPAVVLAHGFAAHRRKPAYAFLADRLREHVHVLSLDLRGHGESGGACTLGGDERSDIAAGLRYLRLLHPWVGVIGVSMGGTATAHALATGAHADAAVLVSTPAVLGRLDTEAMRQLDRIWRTEWRRLGYQALVGIRIVPPDRWDRFPDPVELVRQVDVPLLIVHGEDDHYFPVDDAEALAAAAAGPTTVWREPEGFGHAEDGISADLADRLARALLEARADGTFPGPTPRPTVAAT